MGAAVPLLTFRVDGQRYGLPIAHVARVVRAVELTPLPGAPRAIRGVFSWHGKVIPAGDLRRRFGRPMHDLELDDHIIIANAKNRLLAILTDGPTDVSDVPAERIVVASSVSEKAGVVDGIAHLADGLVLIQDLDRFLSSAEDAQLTEALNADA
jgi:purine-binding chemotaxis protein CheW